VTDIYDCKIVPLCDEHNRGTGKSLDLVDSAELVLVKRQPDLRQKQTPPGDDANRHCTLRGIGTEKSASRT
jgi:hypothetical protein